MIPLRSIGLITAILAAFSPSASPADPGQDRHGIVFLGSFYSEVQGDEYLYQDQIDLWRDGSMVFGLTASAWGYNTIFDRFEGTLDEKSGSLQVSESMMLSGFRGMLEDTVLTGGTGSEALDYKREKDHLGSRASLAPTTSYEIWLAWADSLIDRAEAKDPGIQRDIQQCRAGDGSACLNIGNRLKYRKPAEARRYWKTACDEGRWAGCKFLGDKNRYLAILHELCATSHTPSLDRNFACEELGAIAEKAGQLDEAVHWYRIGCNEFKLPTTCCDRLKALGVTGQKVR